MTELLIYTAYLVIGALIMVAVFRWLCYEPPGWVWSIYIWLWPVALIVFAVVAVCGWAGEWIKYHIERKK